MKKIRLANFVAAMLPAFADNPHGYSDRFGRTPDHVVLRDCTALWKYGTEAVVSLSVNPDGTGALRIPAPVSHTILSSRMRVERLHVVLSSLFYDTSAGMSGSCIALRGVQGGCGRPVILPWAPGASGSAVEDVDLFWSVEKDPARKGILRRYLWHSMESVTARMKGVASARKDAPDSSGVWCFGSPSTPDSFPVEGEEQYMEPQDPGYLYPSPGSPPFEDAPAPVPAARPVFDTVNFFMQYEEGELDEEEIITGFQHLIDSGLVWQLQGYYGRTAAALIQKGYCHQKAPV